LNPPFSVNLPSILPSFSMFFLVKPLNFRQFFVGDNQALCLVAGTMSGAVRSVILQHFAKGGSLPPGAGVRCCFSIETWIDFKVNKREI
jgi:hypothetical protein